MKTLFRFCLCLAIALFFTRAVQAQQNLVPNPSFEDTSFCSMACISNFNQVSNWFIAAGTPDFVNSWCSTCPIPNFYNQNFIYYQYPNSGLNYINLAYGVDRRSYANIAYHYREIVGCKLNSDLEIGKRYLISFYYNSYSFPGYLTYSNDQGILFSTKKHDFLAGDSTFIYGTNHHFAHVSADSINRDSINWTLFQKYFVADSAYEYLYLGNFYDSTHTRVDFLPCCSGNFFDDISVILDTTYQVDGMEQQNERTNIHPNPVANELFVSANYAIKSIEIWSSLGFLIKVLEGYGKQACSNKLDDIPPGHYILKINSLDNQFYFKQIIKI
jgi:hypothetical protein